MIRTFWGDALDRLGVVEVVEESIFIIISLATILDYEVTWKFMLLLRLMNNVCSLWIRLSSWRCSLILIHNISKVDPLVTSLILASVLSWIGCRTSNRVIRLHTYPLLLVSTHKNGWFTMSSAWRLWSLVNLLCIGLCVCYIWWHDVHDSLVLLNSIQEALDLLMARSSYIRKTWLLNLFNTG